MLIRLACAAALVLSLGAGSAFAHHSYAMFDRGRTENLAGTVKSFEMINPHGWLTVVAPDAKGQPREWALETAAPGQLQRQGWNERTLSPGDKVTATIHPLKDGSNGGQLVTVKLPGGEMLGGQPGFGR